MPDGDTIKAEFDRQLIEQGCRFLIGTSIYDLMLQQLRDATAVRTVPITVTISGENPDASR